MKKSLFLVLISFSAYAQQLAPLTVEKIMRDPKWIGVSPGNVFWSEDSKQVYFNWNPEKNEGDSLYTATIASKTPQKINPASRRALPSVNGEYNKTRTRKLYEKNGDIFLLDVTSGKLTALTNTIVREFGPHYSTDEKKVFYMADQNLYSFELATGSVHQWSDFKRGTKKGDPKQPEQEKWLSADQLAYMEIVNERAGNKKATEKQRKADHPKRPKEIFIEDKNVDNVRVSPDEKFITYRLAKLGTSTKNTLVPSYVTESGFTTDIPARLKVGATQNSYEMFVYDISRDTVLAVKTNDITGILDEPDYKKDYASNKPKDDKAKDAKPTPRATIIHGPVWSPDGKNAAVVVRSQDNKDRWIMLLDCATQKLTLVDRQRDEAWIGGPNTGGFGSLATGALGWLADSKALWFASEESGYSHLYSYDVTTSKKTTLTSGKYEVQSADLSNDKKSFYIITNEIHPGEKHFYKLPVTGGKAEKLTSLTGNNEVTVSPDEKWLAIRYSYSNKPWELFLQENKAGAKAIQITNSISDEFKSYNWRDPELTTIKARDGADIYARLYRPANPNGAAVVFVHGAGYLQNAHKWWSSYFREYMFHNLLADKGYTVLDMDYRASAGYGRDWRTGIYRFMGGKDLTDNVDGAKWLVDNAQVDPKRIGVYGGSYGGFITLMALFTTPDVFASGAALRPVTDWAHYNHPYTSSILNEPYTDSLAYARSSPLYHAKGLKGKLLICHGMVDVNVHFQDAVRLSQRLIELGKDNWELAVYPMEDHGFVEASSWTDEYKRILKLFDESLLTKKAAN
ncbi:MAG TPA: prolyl oligopeptidase family serine peptidase [Cyclobacteriaceae bacterium]|nr:prolyl oligopeptidase family serine peptidase [Cyclobacteriaceae bacterium]